MAIVLFVVRMLIISCKDVEQAINMINRLNPGKSDGNGGFRNK